MKIIIIHENDNTVIYNTNNPFRLEKSSTAKKKFLNLYIEIHLFAS